MRLLIDIANAGVHNVPYMYRVLDEFSKFSDAFNIDIIVHSSQPAITEQHYKSLRIKEIIHKVGFVVLNPGPYDLCMTYYHRKIFRDNQDNYDLFLHMDNDHLITEQNIRAFLDIQSKLPPGYVCGFLQYEVKPGDPEKHLFIWTDPRV